MAKAADAFRTISEVAQDLSVEKHVLRFWEGRFAQLKPMKRGGGRRYYRPEDIDLLKGIQSLLYRDSYTIRGVQKILREQGVEYVKQCGRGEQPAAAPGTAPASPKRRPGAARKGTGKAPEAAASAAGEGATGERRSMLKAALASLEEARAILKGEQSLAKRPAARSKRAAKK